MHSGRWMLGAISGAASRVAAEQAEVVGSHVGHGGQGPAYERGESSGDHRQWMDAAKDLTVGREPNRFLRG